uniref:AlNc14C181G8212 protein n=1 Tax=Albugo laibachii Nc14 TaxID=890382 RepID=F0WP64_9STRA|nr:AlNc14C181G8212 [Albugo laibachii Nc14]|eukprot:CCA23110.1 AlNc14C181G8212 [Albugo laibachii Nc14]
MERDPMLHLIIQLIARCITRMSDPKPPSNGSEKIEDPYASVTEYLDQLEDSEVSEEISELLQWIAQEEARRLRHCDSQRGYRARKRSEPILALKNKVSLLHGIRNLLQESASLQRHNSYYQAKITEIRNVLSKNKGR